MAVRSKNRRKRSRQHERTVRDLYLENPAPVVVRWVDPSELKTAVKGEGGAGGKGAHGGPGQEALAPGLSPRAHRRHR